MRHSHLNKRKAFEFIATELEQGRQVSDQQLQELCCFFEREHVKTLLADLADEGAISISWDGPVRTIALGPRERAKLADARPVPSVVRPAVLRRRARETRALDPEFAANRILEIVRGGRAEQATGNAATMIELPQTDAARLRPMGNPEVADYSQVCNSRSASEARSEIKVEPDGSAEECEGAPQAVKARPIQISVSRQARHDASARAEIRSRAISTTVPKSLHDRIHHAAIADDVTISTMAFQLLEEACAARDCGTHRRHRLSAAVLRAWRSDGRPLEDFVTWLIQLGLEEHDRIMAHAEAAE